MTADEKMGARVRQARADAGVTQADLARLLGVSRSALSMIETGKRRVTAVELGRLAALVDRPVNWFYREAPR